MPAFPSGVHLKGGSNAASVLAAMAREFYAPIIPVVMELRRQGLSLRAIANELEQRGIRPRYGCQAGWSAAQVRRVLIRAEAENPVAAAAPIAKPPEGPPRADIKLWFDRQTRGPFTKAQVKIMLDARTVTRETHFWRPGMAEGRPLRELFGGAEQNDLDADL